MVTTTPVITPLAAVVSMPSVVSLVSLVIAVVRLTSFLVAVVTVVLRDAGAVMIDPVIITDYDCSSIIIIPK